MWHFTEILSKFTELLVGCPVTALYFTVSASFPEWAPNFSEACPGRHVKDLNVLLPQVLLPIIFPCGYYCQIQHGFGKTLFQLVLWQEKCLFREALKVVTCYLLSNLETCNFGCFIDSAGIPDYVFRKLNSILYTWRTCFQWKTAVEKKLKAMLSLIWEPYLSRNLFSFSSLLQFRNLCRNL